MSAATGRPRGELTPAERQLLVERVATWRTLQRVAVELRADLAVALKTAQANGASVRVMAEATGMTPTAVQRLIERGK